MKSWIEWPFVLKSTYREVQLENYTLRDALREANGALRKRALLIAKIRSGQIDIATLRLNDGGEL